MNILAPLGLALKEVPMGSFIYDHIEWILWALMALAAAVVITVFFYYDGNGNRR